MLSRSLIEQARAVDLVAFAGRYTSLSRMAATGGGEYAGPCPLCGGRDRFRVQAVRRRWLCRYCSPRWDDAISLQMRLTGASFRDAVQTLIDGHWLAHVIPVHDVEPGAIPSPRWQQRAIELAREAAHTLWQTRSQPALGWLLARGLTADTLLRWQIGFVPEARREFWKAEARALYMPRGITIPGFTEHGLTYLKVRRLAGARKYTQVRGSVPGLYLAETLRGASVVAICEGEFDALLLWQQLHAPEDLRGVGVVTPGSQSPLPRTEWRALLAGRRVMLLFDQDEAGQRGAQRWHAALPNSIVLDWPHGKDLTDFHLQSGSLVGLIRSAL